MAEIPAGNGFPAPAQVLKAGTPRTILLADDQPQVLTLLAEVLAENSYRLLSARNGIECLALARLNRPDLVLLDVLMPALNGIDTCRALKSDPRTASAKVVLLTALAQEETFRRGLDAGADAIITKPFSPMALMQKVNSLLHGV